MGHESGPAIGKDALECLAALLGRCVGKVLSSTLAAIHVLEKVQPGVHYLLQAAAGLEQNMKATVSIGWDVLALVCLPHERL